MTERNEVGVESKAEDVKRSLVRLTRNLTGENLGKAARDIISTVNDERSISKSKLAAFLNGSVQVQEKEKDSLEKGIFAGVFPFFGLPIDPEKEIKKREENIKKEKLGVEWLTYLTGVGPKRLKIISWNVNGIRAGIRKGLWNFVKKDKVDIYCFQETKAREDQLPEGLKVPKGYKSYWNSAERAGYSGVATLTKLEPKTVIEGSRDNDWDEEGRVLVTKFDEFTLLNVYFPNGKKDGGRLDYKIKFYEHFLKYINRLRQGGEKVIFCGDVNTAHKEIDLARPRENEAISGFLPVERRWMDKLVKAGWVDTYRMFYPKKEMYSWWSMRSGARVRNVGWRIDYVFVDKKLKEQVKKAFILDGVEGSDHCPVGIEIEV